MVYVAGKPDHKMDNQQMVEHIVGLVEHLLVVHLVVGLSGDIDHAGALAAAGEADVGVERLARAIDHAADDRQRHGR